MTVWAQVAEADVPRVTAGMPVYFTTLGMPEKRYTATVRQVLIAGARRRDRNAEKVG